MHVQVGEVGVFFEVVGQEWVLDGERMRRRRVLRALHGGPGLHATKLRFELAPLADVAQVVVPDQRGHGRSDRGAPETWNLASWSSDAKALCDVLGLERPVVLGALDDGRIAAVDLVCSGFRLEGVRRGDHEPRCALWDDRGDGGTDA